MTHAELQAHIEIAQVLYRYCRGVDRGDRELIRSAYHPDAIDEHGHWTGLGFDLADHIVDLMEGLSIVGQHHVTNILIDVHPDGESAICESYYMGVQPLRNRIGEEYYLAAGGRFLDRFEYRDGQWKIAHRRLVLDWSRKRIEGEPWPGASGIPGGGLREKDPSWSLLGERLHLCAGHGHQ